MSDTSGLKPYVPRVFPRISGGEASYLQEELQRISVSIALIIEAMKKLEARLDAGGI